MLAESPVVANVPVANIEKALAFYTDTLGLKSAMSSEGATFMECGNGTMLALYETPSAGQAQHTIASWKVNDVETEMNDLKDKGVAFENYDMPGLKTENGIATMGDEKAAWFKDLDGNIMCIAQM